MHALFLRLFFQALLSVLSLVLVTKTLQGSWWLFFRLFCSYQLFLSSVLRSIWRKVNIWNNRIWRKKKVQLNSRKSKKYQTTENWQRKGKWVNCRRNENKKERQFDDKFYIVQSSILWIRCEYGWKKSLLQVIVVVQVHEEAIKVRKLPVKTVSHPGTPLLSLLPWHLPDVTQQIVSSLSQYCDMHPELALLLGRERSREVARGDDVFDLRVPFG